MLSQCVAVYSVFTHHNKKGVGVFYCNVLYLILGYDLPSLKKGLAFGCCWHMNRHHT